MKLKTVRTIVIGADLLAAVLILLWVATDILPLVFLALSLMAGSISFACFYLRCPHCGTRLWRKKLDFCPHCGKSLQDC